jgi:methylase of polypeptide subunit release factors
MLGNKVKWSDFKEKYSNLKEISKGKKLPWVYHLYDDEDFRDVSGNLIEGVIDSKIQVEKEKKINISNELGITVEEGSILNEFALLSCEIGCGSSLTSFCFTEILMKHYKTIEESNNKSKPKLVIEFLKHFCFDVNSSAINLTKKNLQNGALKEIYQKIISREANFCEDSSFKSLLCREWTLESSSKSSHKNQKVRLNMFIFNPPYVTTDDEELEEALNKKDISASWAGGQNGSVVIHSFITYLKGLFMEIQREKSQNISEKITKDSKYKKEYKADEEVTDIYVLYRLFSNENEYCKIISELEKIGKGVSENNQNNISQPEIRFVKWEVLAENIYKNERLAISNLFLCYNLKFMNHAILIRITQNYLFIFPLIK